MNWNHTPRKLLITGKSGSGKTTLWLHELRRSKAARKFIFDPDLEVSRRLGLPWCNSLEGLHEALRLRCPVVYCPDDMWPADRKGGFEWFCTWILAVSGHLRGTKVFCVDEIWRYVHPRRELPESFAVLLHEGRKREIDLLLVAQKPNKVHEEIRGQLTEILTFQHTDSLPLRWIAEDFDPVTVKALQYPGGYIRKNLEAPVAHSNAAPSRNHCASD